MIWVLKEKSTERKEYWKKSTTTDPADIKNNKK